MSLLETYDKNKEKHLLDEVTAATAVGGFTGKGGQLVDRLFGGSSTFKLGPWFKEYLKWFFWGIKKTF